MKTLLPTIALTAAAAMAFVAPSANALATVDFRGNSGLAKAHTFVQDDITITAHATATKGKNTHSAHVGQYSNGLGVTNHVTTKKYYTPWGIKTKTYSASGDSHQVDGKGHDDTLWLSFSSPFKITAALFTYVGKFSDKVVVVDADGDSLGWYNLSAVRTKGTSSAHLDLSGLDYTGDSIGFKATGSYDGWKVAGVQGHAVPTPSAAAAGLLGLAAISARRRRKTEVVND